ncbi:MAG TPA: hypothetical protein VGF55_00435, partial [Gemmataceae bacterium]
MRPRPFITGGVVCGAAVGWSLLADLGWPPPAAADDKGADRPAVTRREPSAGELRALVSHVPEAFRGGRSDADL